MILSGVAKEVEEGSAGGIGEMELPLMTFFGEMEVILDTDSSASLDRLTSFSTSFVTVVDEVAPVTFSRLAIAYIIIASKIEIINYDNK